MLGKKPIKYKCFYKVRDKNTGLFSMGGCYPRFKKGGKVWYQIGHLKNHLNQFKALPVYWEVCEYPVIEPIAFPAVDYFTPADPAHPGYRSTAPGA